MDPNNTSIGSGGIDFTMLEIVELIPVPDGFFNIKRLPEYSDIGCEYNGCSDLAEFVDFMVCRNERHAVAYHCHEHSEEIRQKARDGMPFEIVQ